MCVYIYIWIHTIAWVSWVQLYIVLYLWNCNIHQTSTSPMVGKYEHSFFNMTWELSQWQIKGIQNPVWPQYLRLELETLCYGLVTQFCRLYTALVVFQIDQGSSFSVHDPEIPCVCLQRSSEWSYHRCFSLLCWQSLWFEQQPNREPPWKDLKHRP